MQPTILDNRYNLIEPLGSGGMAEVHLAHDTVLDRDVALKVMNRACAEDEEFVERFRREARSAASLSHPNIVPIYDQNRTEEGTYYIAMEYLPRGTLKDSIVRRGAFETPTAAGVAMEIAEALEGAHERGVIHRDIKSQNVLVTEKGDVKVADFGIARAANSASTKLSGSGAILGTASYMAPEQAMGKQATPRSDLYSLGIVFYEMLTGELPFRAESPVATSVKHVNEPPPHPRESNPNIPEEIDALVVKLLAKDPEDRYESATDLIKDLERVRDGSSPVTEDEAERWKEEPYAPDRRERDEKTGQPVGKASGSPAAGETSPMHSPGMAAVLSLLFSGVGQIYNGQILKGLVVIVVQLINLALTNILIGWIPLVIVWVWAVVDAHRTAERINAGVHKGAPRRVLPWIVAAVSAIAALLAMLGLNPLQGF